MGIYHSRLKVNYSCGGIKVKGVGIKLVYAYLKIALCHAHNRTDFTAIAHLIDVFEIGKSLLYLLLVLVLCLFISAFHSTITVGCVSIVNLLLGNIKHTLYELHIFLLGFQLGHLPLLTVPYKPPG